MKIDLTKLSGVLEMLECRREVVTFLFYADGSGALNRKQLGRNGDSDIIVWDSVEELKSQLTRLGLMVDGLLTE